MSRVCFYSGKGLYLRPRLRFCMSVCLMLRLLTIFGGSCHEYHFCSDKIKFVATKHVFCCDKRNSVTTKLLSLQIVVATNVILSRQMLRQAYFCRDKHGFVATKHVFCRDKSMLAATKTCLSRQKYFCAPKMCFITTNTCLSRQKWYLWQLPPMIWGGYNQRVKLVCRGSRNCIQMVCRLS